MMKKILNFFMVLGLFIFPQSCANNGIPPRAVPAHLSIDPELAEYINDYKMLFSPETQSVFEQYRLSAAFERLPGDTAGVCYYFLPGIREVVFDKEVWAQSNEMDRRFLVYHELTHCLCNRGHTWSGGRYKKAEKEKFTSEGGYMDDECPESLMHPRMLNWVCMLRHEEHYLAEMRENCVP